ncbi:hypothetical protein R1flu_029095 [Riccia fluitans]|uniref:Uncharacterized protein n=1 Tax=Riccia fluitans TaxID=41844 RepID=A0ABD1XNJ2_9MARC
MLAFVSNGEAERFVSLVTKFAPSKEEGVSATQLLLRHIPDWRIAIIDGADSYWRREVAGFFLDAVYFHRDRQQSPCLNLIKKRRDPSKNASHDRPCRGQRGLDQRTAAPTFVLTRYKGNRERSAAGKSFILGISAVMFH